MKQIEQLLEEAAELGYQAAKNGDQLEQVKQQIEVK